MQMAGPGCIQPGQAQPQRSQKGLKSRDSNPSLDRASDRGQGGDKGTRAGGRGSFGGEVRQLPVKATHQPREADAQLGVCPDAHASL